jgi:hypothetical protein
MGWLMGLEPTTTGITISGVDQALARVPGSRGNECRTIKHHSARAAGVHSQGMTPILSRENRTMKTPIAVLAEMPSVRRDT